MNTTNTFDANTAAILANNFYTVLISGGFSAVVSAALLFLARNWIGERLKASISSEYQQKLETHKAQLQAANDAELERLKAQLQTAAAERSIKLTRVFENQADILAKIYELLQELAWAYNNLSINLNPEFREKNNTGVTQLKLDRFCCSLR
jgi:hypothetical protein